MPIVNPNRVCYHYDITKQHFPLFLKEAIMATTLTSLSLTSTTTINHPTYTSPITITPIHPVVDGCTQRAIHFEVRIGGDLLATCKNEDHTLTYLHTLTN
jgi:hypothetical protein